MPRRPKSTEEEAEAAAMLVVQRGYTIAAAEKQTGVTRWVIRRILNDYGAKGIDMRKFSQFSNERKSRRKMIMDAISETKNFAEAGRRFGMSRQRAFQIWKKHSENYTATKNMAAK
jgi:transposase